MITFYLNGKRHEITQLNPNTTVLEYLRLHARQTDTKEGCGSGDCGACTVMAQRLSVGSDDNAKPEPFYTLNSCITLLSLMDGHHVMTASYLADNPKNHPELATLHPAQQAMVACHGSQCGFCTPGFVMSLASVYENKRLQKQQNTDSDKQNNNELNDDDLSDDDLSYDEVVASISGNLCRCTGYRPIIDAGLMMNEIGQQQDSAHLAKDLTLNLAVDVMANSQSRDKPSSLSVKTIEPTLVDGARQLFVPQSIDELNQVLTAYPEATIWAGGTDLGLSITQHLVDHDVIIQLSAVKELKAWSLANIEDNAHSDLEHQTAQELVLGAGMSYHNMLPILEQYFPEFGALFERIASPQIRNMGTIGGNVANASPIGDLPPILLALGARIHLRHCADMSCAERSAAGSFEEEIMPLSEFFLDYKKTKLRAGSYIVAIHIPLMQDNQHLFIHKISKRYEDDISACLIAAKIALATDGLSITHAKIGLGGMAAVPLLATHCQNALTNQPVDIASFEQAAQALPQDVSPMTDVRASREYRMHVVQRLLIKCGKQLITKTDIACA